MIKNGKEEWLPLLTKMWQEAFSDSREEIQRFHNYFFQPESTWCYVKDGAPAAVIYGIPALYWQGGAEKKLPLIYLYGGSSRKELRGRGYYGELLRRVGEKAWGKGIPILVPVKELVLYYKKLGFHLLIEEEEKILSPDGKGKIGKVTHLNTGGEYKQMRDSLLGKAGYVEWDENFLSYVIEGVKQEDGIAAMIQLGVKQHILLALKKEGCLRILESSITEEEWEKYGASLLTFSGCNRLCRKGMLLMSREKNWAHPIYFRIALDE